jgi:hypothetical protein
MKRCIRGGLVLVLLLPALVVIAGEQDKKEPTDPKSSPEKKTPFKVGNVEYQSQQHFVVTGRRCGTRPVATAQRLAIHARTTAFLEANRNLFAANAVVTVPVHFHVIHDGPTGKVAEARLGKQLEVLNEAYKDTGFKFVKHDVSFTDNAEWFRMELGSAEEVAAKKALKNDPKRVLNFYTAEPPGGVLGWARFPWELIINEDIDGLVIMHTSLPGGDAPYDQGKTAVHEAGHWLGLYHTFGENPADPCDDTDQVSDTPAHHVNYGSPPATTDTCPNKPGNDPVHNYMNYVDDAWMTEFTKGQVERFQAQVAQYRPLLLPPAIQARIMKKK